MNKKDNYLYLFTSNFGEYYKDVMEILALPNELPFRFRFEAKYISKKIKKPLDISGTEGMICLKNLSPGDDQLIPLRKFQLVSPSVIDERELDDDGFIVFDFILKDFPDTTEGLVSSFSKWGKEKFEDKSYVEYQQKFSHDFNGTQKTNWKNIVDLIQRYDKFNKCAFLRVNDLTYTSGSKNIKDTKIRPHKCRYTFAGGQNVRVEYFHYFPIPLYEKLTGELYEGERTKDTSSPQEKIEKQSQQFSIKLKMLFSSEVILPIFTEDVLTGRYQMNKMDFYCGRLSQDTESFLIINPLNTDQIYFPRVRFPIQITRSWNRESLFIALTAVALFFAGIADFVIKQFINQDFKILAPILTFTGLVLALVSRWPKK